MRNRLRRAPPFAGQPRRYHGPAATMSLIGQSTALISLGSSCQTSQQLRVHAQAISDMLDEDMGYFRLPFDWVVSSPASTARWLNDGLPFPASAAELEAIPNHAGTFLWRQRKIYFWHDFQARSGTDLHAAFASTATQYAWCADRFRGLANLRRVILVVANTQNNLAQSLPAGDAFDNYSYTTDNLVALKLAAENFLGRRCDMLCVTHAGRCAPTLRGIHAHSITVAKIPQDSSRWEGHAPSWRTLLHRYLAPALVPA